MAWAILTADYTHDFRPQLAMSRDFKPSDEAQQVPQTVLDGAVKVGKARPAKAPKRAKKPLE